MKKITLIIFTGVSLFLTSCGAKQEAVDNMADEMCKAMAKYDEAEPMTIMAAAEDMDQISKKQAEYGDITEDQLKETMEKKCPDGYSKFMRMVEEGEAADAEMEKAVEVETEEVK